MNSIYKFWGGFGILLGVNLIFFILAFRFLCSFNYLDLIHDNDVRLAYIGIIGFYLFFVIIFTSDCRQIKIDNDKVRLINPIIPFMSKTLYWSDIDYYTTVIEASNHEAYEAVWFIKNNKLIGRFSSAYYSNYSDLKRNLKIKSTGESHINPFKQLFILLGVSKIK